MPARGKENGLYQGMNWIRPERRLALYLRDGLACCYCGEAVEDGAKLTLDHLTPHSQDGGNENENLVTCCHRCNSSRGDRDWRDFAKVTAAYLNHDVSAAKIITHIQKTITRSPDLATAKDIIARRGNFSRALTSLREEG